MSANLLEHGKSLKMMPLAFTHPDNIHTPRTLLGKNRKNRKWSKKVGAQKSACGLKQGPSSSSRAL